MLSKSQIYDFLTCYHSSHINKNGPARKIRGLTCEMKLKELEGYLGNLDSFQTPKILLEQYETQPHIAARMLYSMHTCYEDIEGKMLADLGCGSGALTVGCCLLDAGSCIGMDIDGDALAIARHNLQEMEIENSDLIQIDITQPISHRWKNLVDITVLNPPFGTKHNKGIDMTFLKFALEISQEAVYSLHKTATREHIQKKVADWGATMTVLAELRFDLPSTYKFHKQRSKDIAVDFIKVNKKLT